MRNTIRKLLNLKIKDFKYIGKMKSENVKEYNFEIAKIIANLEDDKKIEIYLNIVKRDKIKESIFCYWLSLNSGRNSEVKNKVLISGIENSEYKNEIIIRVENNGKFEIYSEIDFLDIEKYLKEKNNIFCENIDEIFDNSEKLLFVGLIKK